MFRQRLRLRVWFVSEAEVLKRWEFLSFISPVFFLLRVDKTASSGYNRAFKLQGSLPGISHSYRGPKVDGCRRHLESLKVMESSRHEFQVFAFPGVKKRVY